MEFSSFLPTLKGREVPPEIPMKTTNRTQKAGLLVKGTKKIKQDRKNNVKSKRCWETGWIRP